MDVAEVSEMYRVAETHSSNALSERRAAAQRNWARTPVRDRLRVLRRARHRLANLSDELSQAIAPELERTPADTRVAEILPLLAACRFLELKAARLLAPNRLGQRGLPIWLAGVQSEVRRVPLGHILVIGPANYPLFLPGVQTLQALAAGNAVTWKPGRGGKRVALLVEQALADAGLPQGLLTVTDESVEAVDEALREAPAKVFFTGSAETGRLILHKLAETLTPSVMELSGCDAVILLPSADFGRAIHALVFGLRLNGSATCMAPRRVLLVGMTPSQQERFVQDLQQALTSVEAVTISYAVREQLNLLLADATKQGACVRGDSLWAEKNSRLRPIVVTGVQPGMMLAQADLFAPVLSVIEVPDEQALLAAEDACPFALTASIFGEEREALALSAKLIAGSVLINDLIIPTADPRVPFGGRRGSGFGVTRGSEGLLEMTAVKMIAVRRRTSMRHYEATTVRHEALFDGLIAASHAGSWAERWKGLKQMMAAAAKLKEKGEEHHGS